MNKLQTIALILISTFSLTSCATPIQSKFSLLEAKNFALTVTASSGFLTLAVNYKIDDDKVYAKIGTIETYVYQTNNTYNQMIRMNATASWMTQAITETAYNDLVQSLIPFAVTTYQESWFNKIDGTPTYFDPTHPDADIFGYVPSQPGDNIYNLKTEFIDDFIIDPDKVEGILSITLVIESAMMTIVLIEVNSTTEFKYEQFGQTTITLPI